VNSHHPIRLPANWQELLDQFREGGQVRLFGRQIDRRSVSVDEIEQHALRSLEMVAGGRQSHASPGLARIDRGHSPRRDRRAQRRQSSGDERGHDEHGDGTGGGQESPFKPPLPPGHLLFGKPRPDPLPPGLNIGNVLLQFNVVAREPWFPKDTPPIPAVLTDYPDETAVDTEWEWQFVRDPACPPGTTPVPPRLFRVKRPFDLRKRPASRDGLRRRIARIFRCLNRTLVDSWVRWAANSPPSASRGRDRARGPDRSPAIAVMIRLRSRR